MPGYYNSIVIRVSADVKIMGNCWLWIQKFEGLLAFAVFSHLKDL